MYQEGQADMDINHSLSSPQAKSSQIPHKLSYQQLAAGICSDFELGIVDEKETFRRLYRANLLPVIMQGIRSLAKEAR